MTLQHQTSLTTDSCVVVLGREKHYINCFRMYKNDQENEQCEYQYGYSQAKNQSISGTLPQFVWNTLR